MKVAEGVVKEEEGDEAEEREAVKQSRRDSC